MRTYDLTPLFRTSVGFDRMSRLMESALQLEGAAKGYPPYNIVKMDENQYRIEIAVAGFSTDEIDITAKGNKLVISGHISGDADGDYLHKGIATRDFSREFALAETVEVSTANIVNGLLTVDLVNVIPDEKKPRKIDIGTVSSRRSGNQEILEAA